MSLTLPAMRWLAFGALVPLSACSNPNALWHIVNKQCVPNQQQHSSPAPCAEVSLQPDKSQGYVVFKDRHGALQYLLIPTAKITGIESPALLAPNSTNYFAKAWDAKSYMEKKHGAAMPREAIALTINSSQGRSQNQLHIHISCVSPAVKQQLADLTVSSDWQAVPGGINHHPYSVRWVNGSDLNQFDPFKEVARALPAAAENMGEYTLAVVGGQRQQQDGFYLLADQANLWRLNFASSEGDIQDHDCKVLKSTAP